MPYKDRQERLEYLVAWRERHPDYEKLRFVRRPDTKERRLAYRREWWKTHKEYWRPYFKKWYSKNYKRWLAYVANRRARVLAIDGRFTEEDVKELYKRQNGECFYCYKNLNGIFEIDHKIPISRKGSTNWPSNICLSCERCNRRKHDKTADEFIAVLSEEAS